AELPGGAPPFRAAACLFSPSQRASGDAPPRALARRATRMTGAPRLPNVTIPDGLRWWRTVTGGADWLDLLPRLVGECAEQWSLEVGASFEEAHVSLVRRAGLPDW